MNDSLASGAATAVRARGSNWTKHDGLFNQVIFGVIKDTYLPQVAQQICNDNFKDAAAAIHDYH